MRIKNLFSLALMMVVAVACIRATAGQPATDILLFHGSRPWVAGETAKILADAGATVKTIDSTLLAGLGGASLKVFPTDKVEPEAKDGITPEFERLGNYRLVVVAGMTPQDQGRFFTQPRVEKLRQHVEGGGSLLVLQNVPSGLSDLLPVDFGSPDEKAFTREATCRPMGPLFAGMPEEWPYFGKGRKITAKPAAEILATICDQQGRTQVPYIASICVGQGRVAYWNSEWRPEGGFRQLRDWTYFAPVLIRLVSHLTGKQFDSHRVLPARLTPPEARELKQLHLQVSPPEIREKDADFPPPSIEDVSGSIRFVTVHSLVV